MNLAYDAIDGVGRTVGDTIEAASIKEAVEALRRKGLFVTHIARASAKEAPRLFAEANADLTKVRFSLRQRVMLTREMAMLLRAGSGVVPALNALNRQIRNAGHQAVIRQIIKDLEEGSSLAAALRKYPAIFDPSYCAVVAAGEASATLPPMFTRLAGIMGKRRAMRNRVLGALTYPALLTVMCAGILNTLLFFVIPRFAAMFGTLGVPLPASTRFLLTMSAWLREWWPLPVGLAVGVVLGAVYVVKSRAGRQFLSDLQIRIPLVGRVMSHLIQAEMLRIFGMLIEAKVSVLEAVDLARGVTRNRRYGVLCDAIEEAVTAGNSISLAMEKSGVVDAGICQAVRTGEESGSLGESISYVADVLDEENGELVGAATKLVEPLILIGMGVVVGIVAVSLFVPLFDVSSAIR
ncbi:MAG: type II secretion system F family protein [Planctomycetota bacterium]